MCPCAVCNFNKINHFESNPRYILETAVLNISLWKLHGLDRIISETKVSKGQILCMWYNSFVKNL
jgi:hypothetical protein